MHFRWKVARKGKCVCRLHYHLSVTVRSALHTCELLSSNQGQSTPYPPIGVKQEKFHSNTSSTSFLYAKKTPHQWRQDWVKIWLPDGEKWDLWHRIYWMSLAMGSECLCHIYISVWWNIKHICINVQHEWLPTAKKGLASKEHQRRKKRRWNIWKQNIHFNSKDGMDKKYYVYAHHRLKINWI